MTKSSIDLKYIETVIKEALPQLKINIPEIKEGPYYRGVQQLGDPLLF